MLGFICDFSFVFIISNSFISLSQIFIVLSVRLAEHPIICLSLNVVLIMSSIQVIFFPFNRLSTSSKTIVFILCDFSFFCFIKSKTLPQEPITMCGFTAFIFFICFCILTSPIKAKEVTESSAFLANNSTWFVICITNSCVGASIRACVSLFDVSIFSNIGKRYASVFPVPVCELINKSLF